MYNCNNAAPQGDGSVFHLFILFSSSHEFFKCVCFPFQAELDRFCDALISIRKEIALIENGKADIHNNVLKVKGLVSSQQIYFHCGSNNNVCNIIFIVNY